MSRERALAVLALALAAGLALRWNAVVSGFSMDDFAHLAMVDGVYPVERPVWDLFRFSSGDPAEVQALMDRGSLSWWSHPELQLWVLRPLSSLLIALDVSVFQYDPTGYHLHSLVWWVFLVTGVWMLARRLLPPGAVAVAVVLYALDESHAFPLGWIANRNAMVSASFGVWGLWALGRWREDGWRPGAWLAPGLFALACAGGEYAMAIGAYVLARGLVGEAGSRAGSLRAAAPSLAVFVVYLVAHRMVGAGVWGSGIYVDPFREPLAFVAAAAYRIPVLLGDLLLAFPTGLVAFHPDLQIVQAVMGVLAVIVLLPLLRRVGADLGAEYVHRIRWLGGGALMGLVPLSSSFASSRLLEGPAIGANLLVALCLWWVFKHRATAVMWMRALAGVLVVCHLLLAPMWSRDESNNIRVLNRGFMAAMQASEIDDTTVAGQRVVVLTAPDPGTLLYPPYMRRVHGSPLPRSWWLLSMAPHPHRVHRVDRHTVELEVVGGRMLTGPPERLFRSDDRLVQEGEEIRLDGMTVTVLDVEDGRPARARFRFDGDPDGEGFLFLISTPTALRRYPLPPPGQTAELPAPSLPMAIE